MKNVMNYKMVLVGLAALGIVALTPAQSKASEPAASTASCSDEIHVGGIVLNEKSEYSIVRAIFSNKEALLSYVSNSEIMYRSKINLLARTAGCTPNKICVGDIVLDGNDEKAYVIGIFPDNQVSLSYLSNSNIHYKQDYRELQLLP